MVKFVKKFSFSVLFVRTTCLPRFGLFDDVLMSQMNDEGAAVGAIVDQVKRQGKFDDFRKSCLADVEQKVRIDSFSFTICFPGLLH